MTTNATANATANVATPAQPAPRPDWIDGFCQDYAYAAYYLGLIFIAIAVALVAAAAIRLLMKPEQRLMQSEVVNGPASAFVAALKGLIEAVAGAPMWLGAFATGAFLLWMSVNTLPQACWGEEPQSRTNAQTRGSTDRASGRQQGSGTQTNSSSTNTSSTNTTRGQ